MDDSSIHLSLYGGLLTLTFIFTLFGASAQENNSPTYRKAVQFRPGVPPPLALSRPYF